MNMYSHFTISYVTYYSFISFLKFYVIDLNTQFSYNAIFHTRAYRTNTYSAIVT